MIWFQVSHFLPVFVEFPYIETEGSFGSVFRPCLPVTLSYGKKRFPISSALVDTGSDMTLLPLEIAHYLEIELDDSRTIKLNSAGGGVFEALPSQKKIGYALEMKGFQPMCWQGTAYFASKQQIILLGHFQCLDKFDLLFRGAKRMLQITLTK